MTTDFDFEDIQGNIVDGYKFPLVAHWFGQVDADAVSAWKAFLRALSPHVTRARWREKPSSTLNVGLSYEGLFALRPGLGPELSARFAAFAEGMPERARALGDGNDFDPEPWRARQLWLSVHAREAPELTRRGQWLEGQAREFGLTLHEAAPRGEAIVQHVNGQAAWYEHFGFRDDISHPAIEDWPALKPEKKGIAGHGKYVNGAWSGILAGEFLLGYKNESGEDRLEGLSTDAKRLLRNGTFGVFRRLRQDVALFHRTVQERARDGTSAEYLASRMMGRTTAGVPVGGPPDADLSSFTYENDPRGAGCPLGAHVRRANPRVSGRHRLIRRGIPFGKPLPAGAEDNVERGLWFVAFNADIEDQFELIQRQWLNGPMGTLSNARDPIASSGAFRNMAIEGDRSVARRPVLLLDIPSFVSCQGGQYYFLPGIGGLDFLSASAPLA